MPRHFQLPHDYPEHLEFDEDDGRDGFRAVAAGAFIVTVGAVIAVSIWFLWGAA